VTIVSRDRTAAPEPHTYSICYINAFQAQPDSTDWWSAHHPEVLLRDSAGHLVMDKQWNEALFDISTAPHRATLLNVIGGWIDGCAASGFLAVEGDNLDSYTRSDGALTADHALAFARDLAARAHQRGVAIGQKNAAEITERVRSVGFDFAIAEECQVFSECERYTAAYGARLIEIEYTDGPAGAFEGACAARGKTVSVLLRDRNVRPAEDPQHVEKWCP